MRSHEALLIDVEDLTLVYKIANDIDATDPKDVNYLLGAIEGAFGKFFTVKDVEDKQAEGCDCKRLHYVWHTVNCGENAGEKVE